MRTLLIDSFSKASGGPLGPFVSTARLAVHVSASIEGGVWFKAIIP
jgi:hypothetical protein